MKKWKLLILILTTITMLMFIFGFASCKDTKPKLTLASNIEQACTLSGEGYYTYDEDVSINITVKAGYYFLGWYNGEELLSTSKEYNLKMWDKSFTLEAKLIALPDGYNGDYNPSQKLTLSVKSATPSLGKVDVDGLGAKKEHDIKKTSGDNVKLVALTTSSQRFMGWFDETGNLVTTNGVFNFVMPIFDYTLRAKWFCEHKELVPSTDNADVLYVCETCEAQITWEDLGYIIKMQNGKKTLVDYVGTEKEITVPSTVSVIGDHAFNFNKHLTSVVIPDNVISIGDYAFNECANLKNVAIGKNVTSIGDFAFSRCRSLTSVVIPDGVISIGGYVFEGCGLINAVIGNGVIKIADSMFSRCDALMSVDISDNVKNIGHCAFEYCSSLTSVDLPDNVRSLGAHAFAGCRSLTSVEIPDRVTTIGDCAFEYCSSLTSITIPDSVTSLGRSAFASCVSLTSVEIGDGVTTINGAFAVCVSLTSVEIGDGVTTINGAFYDCEKLMSVVIGSGVTEIDRDAFHRCYDLTSVYYKGTAEDWSDISIGNGVEYNYLTEATRYYYSETKPTSSGDYWHYDGNGGVVIW